MKLKGLNVATLWAKTVNFESVQVGDELPILVKHENQMTIDLYAKYASAAPKAGWNNLHTDKEYASKGIFGGTVNMGVATVAYVAELLEKAFPIKDITGLYSNLGMRATEPFRDGDTVTFTGQVTGKRVDDDRNLVECEVIGVNQHERTVARATATIVLTT